jgi:signal transduction histidine kinase
MLHQQFALEPIQNIGVVSPSPPIGNTVDYADWNLFNLGLALLSADLRLLSWNQALPRMLNAGQPLLPNTSLLSTCGMTAVEGQALHAVLAQTSRWTNKRRVGQHSIRLEITRIAPRAESTFAAYALSVSDYSTESRETQALEEAKTLAERNDRAKSQFLSHMSHELRTPLNAILGFSQLLSMDDTLNAEQKDSLNEVENAGHYLLRLINEILDLARIDAGRIELQQEPVLLEPLLHECFALVKPLADAKRLTLRYALNPALSLQSDHVRLKQILLNLLSNAVKYNEAGGKVLLQCAQLSGSVRIEVIDSGHGIAPAAQASIFSPFERLGAERGHIEGTGIGLMITRRLVKLMNGDIGLVSNKGAGSIFWLELPTTPAVTSTFTSTLAPTNAPTNTPTNAPTATPTESRALFVLAPLTCPLSRLIAELRPLRPHWQISLSDDPGACSRWLSQYPASGVLVSQDLQTLLTPASFQREMLKQCHYVAVIPSNVTKYLDIPIFELDDKDLCQEPA